jgi:large subunit ribosomal protein L23
MKQVIKRPILTEKATKLSQNNQYLFEVSKSANKEEIKKMIENLYKVDVLNVKIVKLPPKQRRLGRIYGWKKGIKKAIVKIKEGQKIEALK